MVPVRCQEELAYLDHTRNIGDLSAISDILSLCLILTLPLGFPYDSLFPANAVFWTLFFALFVPVPVAARGLVDPVLVLFVFPAVLRLATLRPPQPGTRLERTLGEISYPLYVLQMPVFTALILVTQRFAPGLIDRAAPWLGIVALTAVSAVCWLLVTRWERPLRRRLGAVH